MRRWMHGLMLLLVALSISQGQPKSELRSPPTLDAAEGERAASALLADLLGQQPTSSTNTGILRIRPRGGQTREFPVRIEIAATATNFSTVYQAQPSGSPGGLVRLTVVHSDRLPNQYLVGQPSGSSEPPTAFKEVAPDDTMVPFADSDFWVADLGLEFLHWPKQRVLRKELRLSQSCDVLESINPRPVAGGYAKVVSWIDLNNGGIVHADAYDAHNELMKQFAPTELKQVNGQKQVEEIEMRNKLNGSRTWLKFNLGQGER